MRKLLLNLSALAVIGMGGAYLVEAQNPREVTTQDCYLNGEKCSDGDYCCVSQGICYNTCPGQSLPDQ